MNPFDAYITCLKKYATFTGRARRSEYWYFALFNIIFIILTVIFDHAIFDLENEDGVPVFTVFFMLAIALPTIAAIVRRLHDIGKSGGWFFIRFVPLIGQIWLIILLATNGENGRNEYGADPKNPEFEEDDIMKHLVE